MVNHAVPDFQAMNLSYSVLSEATQRKRELTLGEWVTLSRYARFDARLAEIFVMAIHRCWKTIAPIGLHEENLKHSHPAVLAVLLEHAKLLEADQDERTQYDLWKHLVLFKVPPGSGGQFFIGVRGFATEGVRQEAEKSLKPYLKWGYLGSEILINKFKAHPTESHKTFVDAATRKTILTGLLKNKRAITTEDYREACGYSVSPRTAQLDLSKDTRLKQHGNTKARVYKLK